MRLILTVIAVLSVSVPNVPAFFAPSVTAPPASAATATGPFAPDVLAVAGVAVTLALFLVARRAARA